MLTLTDLLPPSMTTGFTAPSSPLALLCLSREWGIVEQHTADLVQQLGCLNRSVTLVVATGGPLHEYARAHGIRCAPLPNGPSRWGAQRVSRLVGWLGREGIQLLVTTRPADLGLAVLLRLARPSLRLAHRQLEPLALKHGVECWGQRQQLRLVDAWVAPLPWMAQQLRTQVGLDPRRLWAVAPPLPAADPPDCSARQARRLLDLAEESPLFGVLDYGSTGTEFAIEALHRMVAEHGSSAELVVMNGLATLPDIARWNRLQQLTHQLGLSQRVHLRPLHTAPAPALFYRALRVLLLPDAGSATYTSLLQALARGCSIVSADSADAVDLLLPGQGSTCFSDQDLAACTGALLTALQAPAMNLPGNARVQQRHSLAEGARQVAAILDYLTPVSTAIGRPSR